jgi:predicted ATPase
MSSIVCPLLIEADWIAGTSAARLRFKSPQVLTDWLRPANVGFGISYALPIVVAGLTSAEDGILVVENPESHLHPGGQSAIGRFLARIAGGGTQVVVETHSDHVLNGIRVAAARDKVIAPNNLIIQYFSGAPDVASLGIDESGSISEWPPGFFDQAEEDLTALARAKRHD